MSASDRTNAPARIPVTMLSGFLGAGKTTLLKHLLENSTAKIACMVNDLASVNIDAKLVSNTATKKQGAEKSISALADMVELQNGCACCSAADELFPAFAELIRVGDESGKPYERVILENSGVAEPQNIRDSFNDALMMGHSVAQRIDLEGMITVVDSVTFIRDFGSRLPLSLRSDLGDGGTNYRPVVDLLVEQIECADVVVLNKVDAVDGDTIEHLKPIVASLNPLAHIVQCSFGKVPIELLTSSGIASKMNTEAQHRSAVMSAQRQEESDNHACDHGHSHDHGHGHGHDHHHSHGHRLTPAQKFGITSFVYSRRKPFHPLRLRHMVLRWLPATTNTALGGEEPAAEDSPIKRVLRSKGFAWLANSHITAFYWSHAGQHFELREEGDWWASVDPAHYPPASRQKHMIYADFDEEGKFGDRRQEIVFIGSKMNKVQSASNRSQSLTDETNVQDHIIEQLDQALLTDEEMQQYSQNWRGAVDPAHPDMLYFKHLNKNQDAPTKSTT